MINNFMTVFLRYLSLRGFIMFSFMLHPTLVWGQEQLTYNSPLNPGWSAENAWSTDPVDTGSPNFNTNWVDGSLAAFPLNSGLMGSQSGGIELTGDIVVGNFDIGTEWPGAGGILLHAKFPVSVRFSDTLDFLPTAGVIAGNNVSWQGDFRMIRGFLRSSWRHKEPYVGTATLEGGTISFTNHNQVGMESRFVIDGGTLALVENHSHSSDPMTIGSITLNQGEVTQGRAEDRTDQFDLVVHEFSGTGGILRRMQSSTEVTYSFTVDQSANTTFSGDIEGFAPPARMQFRKAGSGTLALEGSIELAAETLVSGGTLLINSGNTSFASETGNTAISVDGGSLGGTGTIATSPGQNVVVGMNGGLTAGTGSGAGITKFELGNGSLDLSAATAANKSGWLRFNLGGPGDPGTKHDQIALVSGTLKIGNGLSMDAFAFQELPGFGPGDYVLFKTNQPIEGSLGTTSGKVGNFNGQLGIVGNDLVLRVTR
jgi:autotransporter-associated beta strand protein